MSFVAVTGMVATCTSLETGLSVDASQPVCIMTGATVTPMLFKAAVLVTTRPLSSALHTYTGTLFAGRDTAYSESDEYSTSPSWTLRHTPESLPEGNTSQFGSKPIVCT